MVTERETQAVMSMMRIRKLSRRLIAKTMSTVGSKIFNRVLKMTERPDYASEIAFWDWYLARRPTSIFDPEQRRRAFPDPLIPFIEELRKRSGQPVKLLEVGSGPVSLLVWGLEQNLLQITAIDPLANTYLALMKKHNLNYPIEPIEGHGEQLIKKFGKEHFDIVYSSNALDHTVSPRECLRNMSRVVRKGGVVCLEGYVREGTNENWHGLHQHDLVPERGRLAHYNKKGVRTDLTNDMNLTCEYQSIRPFRERSFNGFGHEYADGTTIEKWYYLDWYTLIFRVDN